MVNGSKPKRKAELCREREREREEQHPDIRSVRGDDEERAF